jgi:hypothetical protein
MAKPPQISLDLSDLEKNDPAKRSEVFADLLGVYIMWIRSRVVNSARIRISSEEDRAKMGKLFRAVYDRIAMLEPEQREAALKFAERCVDNFAQELLMLLSHVGNDLRLSSGNVIRLRLDMEIINPETDQVLASEGVNRGRTYLPSRWGRWLNQSATQKGREDPSNEVREE